MPTTAISQPCCDRPRATSESSGYGNPPMWGEALTGGVRGARGDRAGWSLYLLGSLVRCAAVYCVRAWAARPMAQGIVIQSA